MQPNNAVKTVLIADDSTIALTLLSRRLSGAGYRVLTAGDGIEAAQKAYSESPDLVILDINMPRLNGLRVCRWLKGTPATAAVPVIVLSATEGGLSGVSGPVPQVDAFLNKGDNPAEFLRVVERLLMQAHSSSEAIMNLDRSLPLTPEAILSQLCALLEEELIRVSVERMELKAVLQDLNVAR